MNTVLIVQLEDLDDNPPEFEFEEKTRDPRSGYAYAKCLFHQQSRSKEVRFRQAIVKCRNTQYNLFIIY